MPVSFYAQKVILVCGPREYIHPLYFFFRECARFCFGTFTQRDLKSIMTEWNTHTIRGLSGGPAGKPDIMYSFPELYGERKTV